LYNDTVESVYAYLSEYMESALRKYIEGICEMNLSENFTELTKEEQETVNGGGIIIPAILANIFYGVVMTTGFTIFNDARRTFAKALLNTVNNFISGQDRIWY